MKPSTDKIWAALMKDPEFDKQPETVKTVVRPFVNAIPDTLATWLDLPVTLANLMAAKFAFIRYCLDHDYLKLVIDAMPEESFGWLGKDGISEILQAALQGALEMAEQVSQHTDELLAAQGVTESQVMMSNVGFTPKVFSLYKAGKLTIGQLLELQPAVIIKNS